MIRKAGGVELFIKALEEKDRQILLQSLSALKNLVEGNGILSPIALTFIRDQPTGECWCYSNYAQVIDQ